MAFIIGKPRGLDILKEMGRASELRLATAFAHQSGWELLRSQVLKAKQVRLLTGLSFCQTEPRLLKEWLQLMNEGKVVARVYTDFTTTFHPKVFIVSTAHVKFALVGSGNLSGGGLRDNVECFAYVSGPQVSELTHWFDKLFSNYAQTSPLNALDLVEYSKKHAATLHAQRQIRALQRSVEAQTVSTVTASMQHWTDAVRLGRKFFRQKSPELDPEIWTMGAKDIRKALKYPSFSFSSKDWKDFYDIWPLGHLIPINRDKVYRQRAKLQRGLRRLVDETLPIHDRIDALLDPARTTYVRHLGLAAVSKILAVHQPNKWPIYNKKVEQALRHFGYSGTGTLSPGSKYAAYAKLMQEFQRETRASDMLHIDRFFYSCALDFA